MDRGILRPKHEIFEETDYSKIKEEFSNLSPEVKTFLTAMALEYACQGATRSFQQAFEKFSHALDIV